MPKNKREVKIKRITLETKIDCVLNVDGKGKAQINTTIGFLDHMLQLFVFHGLFDLLINARGDLQVDSHHTNEDVGIVLGQAFKKALADKRGINRFGFALVPMEDMLASVTLDIAGRSHFSGIRTNFPKKAVEEKDNYGWNDANHFFESLVKQAGINLIIKVENAQNNSSIDLHTALEPVFKALALALDRATAIDPRRKGVPSTKGIID